MSRKGTGRVSTRPQANNTMIFKKLRMGHSNWEIWSYFMPLLQLESYTQSEMVHMRYDEHYLRLSIKF